MKKFLIGLLIVITVIALVMSGIVLYTDYDSVTENGVGYYYNPWLRKASATWAKWDPDDPRQIVISDTVRGIPVRSLGNYVGGRDQFCLDYNEKKVFPKADDYFIVDGDTCEQGSPLWDEVEITDRTVEVVLPATLRQITWVDDSSCAAVYELEDGTRHAKILRVCYYFTISGDNSSFYTENGKLYYKSGRLVEGIYYSW